MIDFAQYWTEVRLEAAASDKDWERVCRQDKVEANGGVWGIDWICFSSAHDSLAWGWWAHPIDRPANGVCMLWLPGYSYGTPPPDATCLVPGACTFCINVHGRKPDEPYVSPAGKFDYILQEIDDPGSYIYRIISQVCLLAADMAIAQPEALSDRLVVGGMSQGAQLAMIVASNLRLPRLCFADMPFLSDARETVKTSSSPIYKAVRRYCGRNSDRMNEVLDLLSLFDPVNHAPYVQAPTWISAGGRDPSVSYAAVKHVYDVLGSEVKHFEFFPEAGHVFLPEMNQAHTRWIEQQILNAERT
jgi:cephalosporin-C deacetylase-like acetyl esterase